MKITLPIMSLLSAAIVVLAPAMAAAQTFPIKPVRLVIPFPPGGSADALARLLATKLSERWKQSVIVENKPGANTVLGTDAVAKSSPDGHVLGIVGGSHIINPMLLSKLPYDTLKDLTGVTTLTRFDMALYAHPSAPVNTPAELIALAKKEPGKVAYAASTTQSFLAMELLNTMAGTKMTYVPYKGSSQAVTDLLGGHVSLMIDPVLFGTLDMVKSGKLKIIGTMGPKSGDLTPGVAVFADTVPTFDYSGVLGLITRGGTPPEVVRRIRDDVVSVLALPEVIRVIQASGQQVAGWTPDEYNAYILAETKKWAPIVKATGAKLD